MSLIEEALRRVQESRPRALRRRTIAPPPAPQPQETSVSSPYLSPPQSPAESLQKPQLSPWATFGLKAFGATLVVGGTVTMALWTYHAVTPKTSSPFTSQRPTSSTQAQPAALPDKVVVISPAPQPVLGSASLQDDSAMFRVRRQPVSPQFVLNGIVEGVGEPFAIINGTIVRLGERIEGATLLEISADKATLRWLDEELELRTTR